MKITLKSPTSTHIKPLHGVGNGPLNYNELLDTYKYFIGIVMCASAECGTVVWSDDIDIAPEHLYEASSAI